MSRDEQIAALVTRTLRRHGLTVEAFSRTKRQGASVADEIPVKDKMKIVQEVRQAKEMSARELAKFLNLHHSTISNLSEFKTGKK